MIVRSVLSFKMGVGATLVVAPSHAPEWATGMSPLLARFGRKRAPTRGAPTGI